MHTAVQRARAKEPIFPKHPLCVTATHTETVCFAHMCIRCRYVKGGCGALNLALLVLEKFLGIFFRLEPAHKFTCMCVGVHACAHVRVGPHKTQGKGGFACLFLSITMEGISWSLFLSSLRSCKFDWHVCLSDGYLLLPLNGTRIL